MVGHPSHSKKGGSMKPSRPRRLARVDDIAARLEAAFNAPDAAALAALYSDTAILMPPNEPMLSGRPAIQSWFERTLQRLNRVRIVPIETRAVGNQAYQVGAFTSTSKPFPDASPLEGDGASRTGKYILLLVKSADGWLIQYDIWSVDQPSG
jgi:ketosteroid isomerase-like protein